MADLKNDLVLKALRGEKTERVPVWMMRQAGRYLPDYLKLKAKYDFFTRVQTPELATEITLQPIDQVGVDAAIIFSDILVIPQAMGLEVLMEEGKGPSLPNVIKNASRYRKPNNRWRGRKFALCDRCLNAYKKRTEWPGAA